MGKNPERNPARVHASAIIVASLGAAVSIGVLASLTDIFSIALLIGSFGSSAFILFAFPELHIAQPRHVVGGHVLSSIAGVGIYAIFGVHCWTIGLAVGLATSIMLVARCVHPPAGSNPIIAALLPVGWKFVLFPTLAGVLLLTVGAWAWHRAWGRRYPSYWL